MARFQLSVVWNEVGAFGSLTLASAVGVCSCGLVKSRSLGGEPATEAQFASPPSRELCHARLHLVVDRLPGPIRGPAASRGHLYGRRRWLHRLGPSSSSSLDDGYVGLRVLVHHC